MAIVLVDPEQRTLGVWGSVELAPSLLDVRVPQPGREEEYGVPGYVVTAVRVLYAVRSTYDDEHVPTIDAAILRLLAPWIVSEEQLMRRRLAALRVEVEELEARRASLS